MGEQYTEFLEREVARLDKEIERLREALQKISDEMRIWTARGIAKKALEDKNG